MNAVTEVARPGKNEIVALVEATPSLVLVDKQKYSEFYEAMKAECEAHVPDLSTERGRKAIASLAHKVARTKTAIDDAGKKLNEEARARINAVDESRREIRQQLDELKAAVRQPLTAWEQAEEKRVEKAQTELTRLREMGRVEFGDTAETVKVRINELAGFMLDAAIHGDTLGIAEAARNDSLTGLRSAHDRLVREEDERAELERLRAEAAERARVEDERKAAEEAERRRAEAAERAAKEQSDRAAREEADRKAAAEREAAAQAAREADRDHRSKIMAAAKEAVMEAGPVDETAARAIVLAIAANSIPNVAIRF